MRGSRRGGCVGRGDRVVRRETGMGLDERALGMEAEMDGGLLVSYHPLAPLKGGDHLSAVAGICRTVQRTARRRGGTRRDDVRDCRGE